MSFVRWVVGLSVSALVLPALATGQTPVGRTDSIYTWRGAMRPGAMLTVRNFNGPIDVRPADGTSAEVRAEKRTRGGNIQDVAFDVVTSSNGDVTLCATYRDRDPCDSERSHRSNDWDDDDRHSVSVTMTVRVPRGTEVRVGTGNGAVSVQQVRGPVQASTGNGRVEVTGTEGTVQVRTGNGDVAVRDAKAAVHVSTGNGRVTVATTEGPVDVRTGNGDIDVRMTTVRAADDMQFHTGSGEVRVTLPASFNGELDASTGNGEVESDFDLKVRGRLDPRRVRATIGTGGPLLRLTAGNGRVELLKSR